MSAITTKSDRIKKFTIDGIKFEVDIDDLNLVESAIEYATNLQALAGKLDDSAPFVEQMPVVRDIAEQTRAAIDAILGDGAYADIFGNKRPIMRAVNLVVALADGMKA